VIVLCIVALTFAAVPAALFLRNLALYVPPPKAQPEFTPRVSVLIPARNEVLNIKDAVRCAVNSEGVEVEVLVADDASEDGTADIVRGLAAKDARVRLIETPPLPSGWNGKQHACHVLAQAAGMPLLCFIDADVRMQPDSLARIAAFLEQSGASLVSGVPRQITRSWMESLLIPLIHFVLLGFLPMDPMRTTDGPAYSAGCGQLFMACKRDYHIVGGHSAIRATLHDGMKLPAAFRTAGFTTDLFDATGISQCRMYHNAQEVWSGLSKNATEGMATAARLPIFTVLLAGGQLLPWVLLAWAIAAGNVAISSWAGAAIFSSYLPRLVAVYRFRQPWWSCVLHPVGVAVLLLIQWFALGRKFFGKPTAWKGRYYGEYSA